MVTKHNKNISSKEFEDRMKYARGKVISDDIAEERLKQRVILWEQRMLPGYKNIKIDKNFYKKIITLKNKGPIRFIAFNYKNSYERKKIAFKIGKSLIINGYSNKDIEIVDLGYLLNSQLDWDMKTNFFKKINNPELKMLIITDVQINSNNNSKQTDIEMFWERVFKLLSDDPNIDVIILGTDTLNKIEITNKASSNFFVLNKIIEIVKLFNFKNIDKKNKTSKKTIKEEIVKEEKYDNDSEAILKAMNDLEKLKKKKRNN